MKPGSKEEEILTLVKLANKNPAVRKMRTRNNFKMHSFQSRFPVPEFWHLNFWYLYFTR